MAAERQKLVHLHSSSIKVPTAAQLNYGEIAVQYASAEPCFYIKDSADNIIKFIDATGIDTKIQAALSAITQTVSTLVGDDTNKSVRTISAEEVAKIVASADSRYDTLKEIADWILSDTTGAAKMANDITHLQEISADTRISALEAISGQSHTHSNKALLDTYTQTESDLANAVDKAHEHENATVLDGITAEQVTSWDSAATNNHVHSNKSVLDGINSTKVTNWDNAYTHSTNGDVHVTTTNKTQWDEAYASAHNHTNKSVLDGINATKIANWDEAAASAHTHDNKALLDTYTQTESDLADAVTKKHNHSNSAVLDTITSTKTSNWDSAYSTVTAHTADTTIHVTSSDKTSWNDAVTTLGTHTADTASHVTTGQTAQWDEAYASAHNHTNKTVLDGISGTQVSNWDAAYETSQKALVGIESGKDRGVTVNGNNELDFTGVYVDCGTY